MNGPRQDIPQAYPMNLAHVFLFTFLLIVLANQTHWHRGEENIQYFSLKAIPEFCPLVAMEILTYAQVF